MALFYKNFRIEAPVANCMAMGDLAAIQFMNFTDKDLEGFWEAWKVVVQGIVGMVNVKYITEMLVHQLTFSKILADDIKNYKTQPSETWDYDDLATIVTAKIRERALHDRTKKQHEEHSRNLLDEQNKNRSAPKKANASKDTKDNEKDNKGEQKLKAKARKDMTPEEKKGF